MIIMCAASTVAQSQVLSLMGDQMLDDDDDDESAASQLFRTNPASSVTLRYNRKCSHML